VAGWRPWRRAPRAPRRDGRSRSPGRPRHSRPAGRPEAPRPACSRAPAPASAGDAPAGRARRPPSGSWCSGRRASDRRRGPEPPLCPGGVLVGARDGGVGGHEVEHRIGGERLEQAGPNAGPAPAGEASVDAVPGPVVGRQRTPARPVARHQPGHRLHEEPVVGAAAARVRALARAPGARSEPAARPSARGRWPPPRPRSPTGSGGCDGPRAGATRPSMKRAEAARSARARSRAGARGRGPARGSGRLGRGSAPRPTASAVARSRARPRAAAPGRARPAPAPRRARRTSAARGSPRPRAGPPLRP
jgi:hypothetical protein